VSWNIDIMAPGKENRVSAAMDHLEETFRDPPSQLVVMLQEVHSESISGILGHS
jgi:predicted Zn-dependent protease with MMP-like domain